MAEELLLVDFENVQPTDLSQLTEQASVVIFVGANQKSVPMELVSSAQELGNRIQWHRIEGSGRNALDFHIACHLGRTLEASPKTRCTVLSKDKGFDPLLRFLKKAGMEVRRINSMLELDPRGAPVDPSGDRHYQRVLEVLGKSDKKNRPRRLRTLSQYIASIFQKKLEEEEINRIIDLLFVNKLISESNNSITYEF
jgi:hypothetical protein